MQSKGEYRVGLSVNNPENDPAIDEIKKAAASLIDLVESIDSTQPWGGERARLKALAQTAIEDAAMWAVKAQTKKENE